MADYQSNVELKLTGDASSLQAAAQKGQQAVDELGKKVPPIMDKSGKAAGEKFGQQMFSAQKKWLIASQDLLRKYGGNVGRILADVLGQFDKLREAQRASRIASGAGGGGGVGGVGAGGLTAAVGAEAGLDAIHRQGQTKAIVNTLGNGKKPKTVWDALIPDVTAVGGISKMVGGLGMLGAAIASVAGYYLIGRNRAEQFKKEVESFRAKLVVEEINKIADPVARTAEILERFGKDGQEKFREMEKTAEEFQKSLNDTGPWRAFGETAKHSLGEIKVGFSWLLNAAGKFGNLLAGSTNEQFGQAVTKEMADEQVRGTAKVLELQSKLDKQKADAVDKAKEDEKLKLEIQKQITDRVWDELDATEQLGHVTDFINTLQKNKNRSLEEELALQRAIADANKLRNGMTPPTVLDPVGMSLDAIPGAVSDYQKGMNSLLNPMARENNPILNANQATARAIQAGREKTAGSMSLSNEFNRINYQRQQLGLSALTPEQRLKIAEDRMLNKQAAKENLDPMQVLADSFREHGALIVKPVFSK